MDKIVRIWVRILGEGTPPTGPDMPSDKGPYRPDIPIPICELPARARGASEDWYDDSVIADLTVAKRPPPGHTYMRIGIYEKDLAQLKDGEWFGEDDPLVPEKDRLISEMVRACRGYYDGKADAFFDGIPNVLVADAARKRMVKDLLIQAVCRGLSAEKAEEIRIRLALPLAEAQASGR